MFSAFSAAASKSTAVVDVTFFLASAELVAPFILPWFVPNVVAKVLWVEVALEADVTEATELMPPIVIVNWLVPLGLDPMVRLISLVPSKAMLLYLVFETISSIAEVIWAVSWFSAAVSCEDSKALLLFKVPNSANLWLSEAISSKETCVTLNADNALSKFKLAVLLDKPSALNLWASL